MYNVKNFRTAIVSVLGAATIMLATLVPAAAHV